MVRNPFIDMLALADTGTRSREYFWATVDSVSPFRVKLDTETVALAATPKSLTTHRVGDRVLCALIGGGHGRAGQLVVLGVMQSNVTPPPEPEPQWPKYPTMGDLYADGGGLRTLSNGWTHYGGGYGNVYVYRDKAGMCHLTGLARGGNYGLICSVPRDWAPATTKVFATMGGPAVARVDVASNSEVSLSDTGGTKPSFVSLSGISWYPGE